ncbi:MAG: hypothetical protein QOI74_3902 [Micromonosporaceae bacterium]|nr:hypothetical protein [Micromonosporaceae bacterium]
MSGQRAAPTGESDPAAVRVVDEYLRGVARRLPMGSPVTRDVLAELRDDLLEATATLTAGGTEPFAAARAAIADFGDEETIARELRGELGTRRARRIGITLLVTGPVVGVCWLVAVFFGTAHATAWRWLLVLVAPVIVIGAAATGLTVVSSGRLSRWLGPYTVMARRASAIAGIAAGTGDLLLLAGCAALLLSSQRPSALFALAAGASTARLVLLGLLGRPLVRRGPPAPTRTA